MRRISAPHCAPSPPSHSRVIDRVARCPTAAPVIRGLARRCSHGPAAPGLRGALFPLPSSPSTPLPGSSPPLLAPPGPASSTSQASPPQPTNRPHGSNGYHGNRHLVTRPAPCPPVPSSPHSLRRPAPSQPSPRREPGPTRNPAPSALQAPPPISSTTSPTPHPIPQPPARRSYLPPLGRSLALSQEPRVSSFLGPARSLRAMAAGPLLRHSQQYLPCLPIAPYPCRMAESGTGTGAGTGMGTGTGTGVGVGVGAGTGMGGHSATSGFSVPPSVAECLGQGSWGCTTLLQRATRNLLQYRPMHHSLPTLDPLNPRQPGGTTGQPGGDSDPSATPQEVPEREEEGEAGLMSSVAMPAAQVGPTPGTPSASPGDTAAAADSQRGRERGEEGAGAERGPVAGEVAVAGARVGGAAGVRGHPGRKKAAVLVVMFQGKSGELRVWLTKRSGRLRSHSGEVALPGGKRDETDKDDADTALREAEEEIGLPRDAVRVVTHLEPFLSKHLLTVTPVVAVLPNASAFLPKPNEDEVETVFSVPLSTFLEPGSHRHEDHEWLGLPYRVHFFRYTADGLDAELLPQSSAGGGGAGAGEEFTIWGLTAAILVRVSCVIFGRSAPFGEFHPQAPNYATVLADLAKRKYLSL